MHVLKTAIIEKASAAVWLVIAGLFALILGAHVQDKAAPYATLTVENDSIGTLPPGFLPNPNAATQVIVGAGPTGPTRYTFHFGVEEGAPLRALGRDLNKHIDDLNKDHRHERSVAIFLDAIGLFASLVSGCSEFLKSRITAHNQLSANTPRPINAIPKPSPANRYSAKLANAIAPPSKMYVAGSVALTLWIVWLFTQNIKRVAGDN